MGSNKYAGSCAHCGKHVPANDGDLIRRDGGFGVRCVPCRPGPPVPGTHHGWHRGELVGLDCETTGVNPLSDRIVQFALAPSTGPTKQWLINPGVEIPAAASAVHGITTEYVMAHGLSPEQAFSEILTELASHRNSAIVVFNALFDLPLLRAELLRYQLQQPSWGDLFIIDPMVILWGLHDRQMMRQSAACEFYGIDPGTAHQALSDASAALALAQAVGGCHAEIAQLSAGELMAQQRSWWREKAADWNTYASRVGRALDDPDAWPLPAAPGSPAGS